MIHDKRAWFSPALTEFHALELKWIQLKGKIATLRQMSSVDYFFVDLESPEMDPFIPR